MRLLFSALILLFGFLKCFSQSPNTPACELINMASMGYKADSLRSNQAHDKAGHLYFNSGLKNQSSELFVYSAWQYGEAQLIDSALIAIKHAVQYGMTNPYILDKLGLEESSRNRPLRKHIDSLLNQINQLNSSVDNFEIITTPMTRFWEFLEKATSDTANAKLHLSNFICEGSNALKDYYHIRYENVDNIYNATILKYPSYYRYLKNHISNDELNKVAIESKNMMIRFSKLYDKAVFPKTYLLPDLLNSSGTLTELGLFVGVDMFAKSDSTPFQNMNAWQISTMTEFENMKFDLVHELMHYQQSYEKSANRNLLMGKLIEEGVCDFLVSLLTDDNEVSQGVQRNLDYLKDDRNYDFVMSELKRDIYSSDLSKWMHNGGAIKDRPSNLGYTMGFLICKSFYDKSDNKKSAIEELLTTDNFKYIIENSDFASLL